MTRILLTRLGGVAGTMLAVSFVVYAVLEIDASDVAAKMLGQFSTPEQRAVWLAANGYDAPFLLRYLRWLERFVAGDWGVSVRYRERVALLLPERLANTAILASLTMLVLVPLSFAVGVAAGAREGSRLDRALSFAAVVTTSVPVFASAVFITALFVYALGWLPGASTMTSGFAWREIVLPVAVLVLYSAGYIARITRASVAEVMAAPYVRTAVMKGASPARVVLRHVLPNAMVAPITVVLLQVPWLLSGVIVVEVFFAYRGFGSLLYEASLNSDVAVIEACAMVSVLVVVATQLLSDLANAWLNPRLRAAPRASTAPAAAAPRPRVAVEPAE